MENINKFIIEAIKPFKSLIIWQFIIAIIWSIDLSLRPYLLKIIINKIPGLNSDNINDELILPICFYLTMSLIVVIAFRIYDYIWIRLNPGLKNYVPNQLKSDLTL